MMEKGITKVFAPRWTGPFVIHGDSSITGNKVGYLKNLINGHRLKPYVKAELAS